MGVSGHATAELRTALRTSSYVLACGVAQGLPHVDLGDALRLTMLAAEKDPDGFERLARRWLERFLAEREPTLKLVEYIAGDLEKLHDPETPAFLREEATARLREVLGKL